MHQHERYRQAKKVTLIGAFMNALLGIIKVIGGGLFYSHALVADGIHSFSDLMTDAMVIFASKYGNQSADDSHPYGHQRIETAAILLLSLMLILVGLGIAWDAFYHMWLSNQPLPEFITLIIALFSILINEGLFHYTKRMGHYIGSTLIIANAWHHRSDAAASLVVLVGLAGSLLGFPYLDALAAIIVGCLIIKMGVSYGWNSIKELVDSAVAPQIIVHIEDIILHVNGVRKIHQLRTRMMGRDIFIDVHILVAPYLSVSEGHYIAQHVHHALLYKLEHVKDVTVHVDPEDDEISCPSLHLPNRKQLEETVLQAWQQSFPVIQTWTLHYLDGKLCVDLICTSDAYNEVALKQRIQTDLKQLPENSKVRLYQMK